MGLFLVIQGAHRMQGRQFDALVVQQHRNRDVRGADPMQAARIHHLTRVLGQRRLPRLLVLELRPDLDEQGSLSVDGPILGKVKAFRYQLTALGAPGPNLYIANKVHDNRFKIGGGATLIFVALAMLARVPQITLHWGWLTGLSLLMFAVLAGGVVALWRITQFK